MASSVAAVPATMAMTSSVCSVALPKPGHLMSPISSVTPWGEKEGGGRRSGQCGWGGGSRRCGRQGAGRCWCYEARRAARPHGAKGMRAPAACNSALSPPPHLQQALLAVRGPRLLLPQRRRPLLDLLNRQRLGLQPPRWQPGSLAQQAAGVLQVAAAAWQHSKGCTLGCKSAAVLSNWQHASANNA